MSANHTIQLVYGGDEYLNSRQAHQQAHDALNQHPDYELIELETSQTSGYDIEEALNPSLLSAGSILILNNIQDADDHIQHTIQHIINQPTDSILILRSTTSSKQFITTLKHNPAVTVTEIPTLDKPQTQLNFTLQQFEHHHQHVQPQAAQQLSMALADRPGELVAMIDQLCFDFPNETITTQHVTPYLTADPQVTGFAVADQALQNHSAQAITMMRTAIKQGIEPIALIGAIAMKCRQMAKASAVRQGDVNANEVHMKEWMIRNATKQLNGWTSQGLSNVFQHLAWADEQCKTNGADPIYALEQCINLIATKGIQA